MKRDAGGQRRGARVARDRLGRAGRCAETDRIKYGRPMLIGP